MIEKKLLYRSLITISIIICLLIFITVPVIAEEATEIPIIRSISVTPTLGEPDQQFTLSAEVMKAEESNYIWQTKRYKDSKWKNIARGNNVTYKYPKKTKQGNYQIRLLVLPYPNSSLGYFNLTNPYINIKIYTPRPVVKEKITPVNTEGFYDFIHNMVPDTGAAPNIEGILKSLVKPFTDQINDFFYLIIFAVPYFILWFRQKNLTVPSIIGIIFGSWMLVKVPAAYTMPAVAILALIIAGGLYSLYVNRI